MLKREYNLQVTWNYFSMYSYTWQTGKDQPCSLHTVKLHRRQFLVTNLIFVPLAGHIIKGIDGRVVKLLCKTSKAPQRKFGTFCCTNWIIPQDVTVNSRILNQSLLPWLRAYIISDFLTSTISWRIIFTPTVYKTLHTVDTSCKRSMS